MQAAVVGLTGCKDSGKSTVGRLIKEILGEENVLILRTGKGGLLSEIAHRAGIAETDENLQDLWSALAKKRGYNFLALQMKNRIRANIGKYRLIMWDGVRHPWDVSAIRACGGVLAFVLASDEAQFRRFVRARQEKQGLDGGSLRVQFRREREKETEAAISFIAKNADWTIRNEDDDEALAALRAEMERFLASPLFSFSKLESGKRCRERKK